MSPLWRLTPWNPATIAMFPASTERRIRSGLTSTSRAAPCTPSVIMPAWEPVKDCAFAPRSLTAIDRIAVEMRSPAVRSISSSREGVTVAVTSAARSSSSSVVSPIAETTTTTSLPAFWVSTMRWATRLIPSASATEEPPNFWTIRLIEFSRSVLSMPPASLPALYIVGGCGARWELCTYVY